MDERGHDEDVITFGRFPDFARDPCSQWQISIMVGLADLEATMSQHMVGLTENLIRHWAAQGARGRSQGLNDLWGW